MFFCFLIYFYFLVTARRSYWLCCARRPVSVSCCAPIASSQVDTRACLAAGGGRCSVWCRDLSMLLWYRELLLRTTHNLTLLCTLNNRECMACTLVRIRVELLRVRVLHGWMRARTPAGHPSVGGPFLQGAVPPLGSLPRRTLLF